MTLLSFSRPLAVVFIAILASCGGRSVPYTGPLSFPAAPHPDDPSEIVSLAFSLSKAPYITETRGHAHSPLGVSGKDTYSFDGVVRCQNQDMHLLTSYHPIAAYHLGADVFLVGRYFHNERFHQWYRLDGTRFQELQFASLPKIFWLVHPNDVKATAIYRFWVLEQLIEAGRMDEAVATLSEAVSKNPHCIFECNAPSEPQNTHCVHFVGRLAELNKGALFYDSLAVCLNAAKPEDDCQDVGFLAYSLTTFRPDQGERLVNEFVARVRHEALPRDERLRDLTWRLEAAKKNGESPHQDR